ncbi:hypothetical protein [Cohnella mopanensis]|uniref:hypothetical protein n=1 Tax=Cohnella mopanensis TaxID=2911966 RepID=UPI001EF84009|nr:hypothetical protein [Cohnella mopanensis]
MDEPQSPSFNGWTSGFGQEQFPGIEGTFSSPPAVINSTTTLLPTPVEAPATKSSLPFNLSSLSDLKSVVDRMGGIEGVLSTMGKVQKFMSTMQQIAPMLKLFMGNKGNKGSKASTVNKTKSTSSRRRSTSRPSNRKSPSKRRQTKRR